MEEYWGGMFDDYDSGREDRGFEASHSCPWMVIYPNGDRSRLSIAQVRDYQKDEWALASRQTFIYEYDARDHAKKLAAEYDKRWDGGGRDHDYLD